MEIIRLLKALVNSVNENSQQIKENTELLKKNQELIKQALKKSGSSDIGGLTDAIKKSVDSLQKGVQVLELQRALQDVRQMMGMVSSVPTQVAPKIQAQAGQPVPAKTGSQPVAPLPPAPQAGTQPKKSKTEEEDSLLKPSDLFG